MEALKDQRTIAEIASEYGVHPNQVSAWKRQALEGLPDLFSQREDREQREAEELQAELYRQIGQLKVELDWLEKKWDLPVEEKRCLIEASTPQISVARQCALVGLARSSFYYEPVEGSAEDLRLMRLLDEQYTRAPFYGVRRKTRPNRKRPSWLHTIGCPVNHNRVARLMRAMGLEALTPKRKHPRTSQGDGSDPYPNLLHGLRIERPDQVWCTDINPMCIF